MCDSICSLVITTRKSPRGQSIKATNLHARHYGFDGFRGMSPAEGTHTHSKLSFRANFKMDSIFNWSCYLVLSWNREYMNEQVTTNSYVHAWSCPGFVFFQIRYYMLTGERNVINVAFFNSMLKKRNGSTFVSLFFLYFMLCYFFLLSLFFRLYYFGSSNFYFLYAQQITVIHCTKNM